MAPPKLTRLILEELLTAEPTFPLANPTKSYWQIEPHALASTQSSTLTETTDTLIIGSGITGTSVAKHVLEGHYLSGNVTILDARTLCSGATGRNGGQLVTFGALAYSSWRDAVGKEEARKIVNYQCGTCDAVFDAASRYAPRESEIRKVTRIMAFELPESVGLARRRIEDYETDHPDDKGRYTFITGEEALANHNIHGVAGAVTFGAAVFWPYRFVMSVIADMRQKFGSRFALEANTAVTEVKYDPYKNKTHPYTVSTSRGSVNARRVVYCTEGHTGKLLPILRGRFFPYRGTMTVQNLGNNMPNRDAPNSWNLHHPPRYDPVSHSVLDGEYYLQQNPRSGYFFFGGGAQTAQSTFNTDDTEVEFAAVEKMQTVLRAYFDNEQSEMIAAWTGIMGFTGDGFPLIGRLPGSMSQHANDGENEWIAVGFNGLGMCQGWRAGEAVAKMILEEEISSWFPDTFKLSAERLRESLTVEASVKAMEMYMLQNEGVEEMKI